MLSSVRWQRPAHTIIPSPAPQGDGAFYVVALSPSRTPKSTSSAPQEPLQCCPASAPLRGPVTGHSTAMPSTHPKPHRAAQRVPQRPHGVPAMPSCVTPACRRPAKPNSTTGMCGACEGYWLKTAIPVAGFFPSGDLVKIGKAFLAEVSPGQSEITAALRIMRGTRHPTGAWEDRPAYRLQPLLHGRWNVRPPRLPRPDRSACSSSSPLSSAQ